MFFNFIKLKKALIELNRVNEQKEEIQQKCRSLDSQVSFSLSLKISSKIHYFALI